jgi:hypothetical protein
MINATIIFTAVKSDRRGLGSLLRELGIQPVIVKGGGLSRGTYITQHDAIVFGDSIGINLHSVLELGGESEKTDSQSGAYPELTLPELQAIPIPQEEQMRSVARQYSWFTNLDNFNEDDSGTNPCHPGNEKAEKPPETDLLGPEPEGAAESFRTSSLVSAQDSRLSSFKGTTYPSDLDLFCFGKSPNGSAAIIR